jgi:hypothetical protein
VAPVPPPTPDTPADDPRVRRAAFGTRFFNALAPDIAAAHELLPDGPEECNQLFTPTFKHPILSFTARVPSYLDWLMGQDMTGPYRYYKRMLQTLSWNYPTGRWVLKAPAHTPFLDVLFSVVPDACVVFLHRDPVKVIPSLCRLNAAIRRIHSDEFDPAEAGGRSTELLATFVEKGLGFAAALGPSRVLPVNYDAVMADPVGTVRRVHEHFGLTCDPSTDDRVRAWLAANPQHKLGVHRYGLEQFGLDTETVNRRFAFYRDWAASQPAGA